MSIVKVSASPSARSWEYGPPATVAGDHAGEWIVALHITDPRVRVAVRVVRADRLILFRELEWSPWIRTRGAPDRRSLADPMFVTPGARVEVRAGRPPIRDGLGVVVAANSELVEVGVEFERRPRP